MSRLLLLIPALAAGLHAGEWSQPVEVTLETELAASYRAKVDGDYLVVEAKPGAGWHVYSMDNELRAEEALKGKMSLGVDGPTQITVSGALEPLGGWLQSEPHDYSKPAMQWYTWGYEGAALFATKVASKGSGPATIAIRGQACDAGRCKNVDVSFELAQTAVGGKPSLDLKPLIPVKTK
ncbi:MAG: hypothetical protein GC160_02480 [Acidobacteria bacterium]|nr:hypothetical protein [Acidobacteriota bacterium]